MMDMRRGREFYSENFNKVIELHEQGFDVKQIAEKLGISYSCTYHWVKGLRKPDAGNINKFREYFEKNGPMPAIEVKEEFPKHNELFLTANKRGIMIKRCILPKKFKEYNTWYFLEGQEKELDKRVGELEGKVREIRERLSKTLDQ